MSSKHGTDKIWTKIIHLLHEFHNNIKKYEQKNRENTEWNHTDNNGQFSFFLSLLKCTFGFGQIWRFPAAAYESGGASFVIIYAITLLTIGNALYFMEVALGQYSSRTAGSAFSLIPAAMGVGYASILYSLVFISYYNQIVAYSLFYLFHSFSNPLPWTKCPGTNNNNNNNDTNNCFKILEFCPNCKLSSFYFWTYEVVETFSGDSFGLDNLGPMIWPLFLCSLVSWIVVYVDSFIKPRQPGWFTCIMVTLPFALFLIFLYVLLSYPGASDGMLELFVPQFDKFAELKIWLLAVEHALYSLGIGMSNAVTIGTHATFSSWSFIDCAIVSGFILFASILCASVFFATIGILSRAAGEKFQQAFQNMGPNLIFIIYPASLNLLPGSTYFSILFFVSLIYVGLTTVSSMFRCITDSIHDIFPKLQDFQCQMNFFLVFICFIIGIPTMSKGGQLYFQVLDKFSAGYPLVVISCAEILAVAIFYGTGLFCEDVAFMTGEYPCRYYRYIWFTSFFILLPLSITHLFYLPSLIEGQYLATNVGYFMFFVILSPIFITSVYKYLEHRKNNQGNRSFRPCAQYGPANGELNERRREFNTERRIF